MRASVILCTYNPNHDRLQRTLDALSAQSLPASQWELILVDNASNRPVETQGYRVPANLRHVRENRPGLLFARIAGLEASLGDIVVFCDDDNLLAPDYLELACATLEADARLGLISGRSVPEFQSQPPAWATEFFGCLALYDHGPESKRASGAPTFYPAFISGGCGAVFRRSALSGAFRALQGRSHVITGRRGADLTSGEDNDIVLMILRQGWDIAYLPQLSLTHLIPDSRLTKEYLARLSEAIARSWVKVLDHHEISPWRPTPPVWLPFQIARAYIRYGAWRDPASYIRWRAACGQFRGRADIHAAKSSAPLRTPSSHAKTHAP